MIRKPLLRLPSVHLLPDGMRLDDFEWILNSIPRSALKNWKSAQLAGMWVQRAGGRPFSVFPIASH